MRRRNIVFDVAGVLFEHNAQMGKLFTPIQPGLDILNECIQSAQEKEHSLYICSNMQIPYLEFLQQDYPEIMNSFKAIVTPTTALAKKPDPQIFQYLLTRYHLTPQDSVFIDDKELNVAAAEKAGMVGIHAKDFGFVRSELKRLKII